MEVKILLELPPQLKNFNFKVLPCEDGSVGSVYSRVTAALPAPV